MKLSEAMEQGWKVLGYRQAFRQFLSREFDADHQPVCINGACAVGAAHYGIYGEQMWRGISDMEHEFPELKQVVPFEKMGLSETELNRLRIDMGVFAEVPGSERVSLEDYLFWLNDSAKLTPQEILVKVEALGY